MNPWIVESIHDFNYFCCPECVYQSKEENHFQTHALEYHEQSKTFFHGYNDNNSHSIKREKFENDQADTISDDICDPLVIENMKFEELVEIDNETSEILINYIEDEQILKNDSKQLDSKTYSCSKCNESFHKLLELVKHFNEKHDQTNMCPLCPDRDFPNMQSVNQHVKRNHLKENLKEKMEKMKDENLIKFQCQFCPDNFFEELSLRKHITRCHSDKILENEVCTEELEIKNYSCSRCSENYDDLLKVLFTLNKCMFIFPLFLHLSKSQ